MGIKFIRGVSLPVSVTQLRRFWLSRSVGPEIYIFNKSLSWLQCRCPTMSSMALSSAGFSWCQFWSDQFAIFRCFFFSPFKTEYQPYIYDIYVYITISAYSSPFQPPGTTIELWTQKGDLTANIQLFLTYRNSEFMWLKLQWHGQRQKWPIPSFPHNWTDTALSPQEAS